MTDEESTVSSSCGDSKFSVSPSPVFLHRSDNPSHLYAGDLLTELNYGEWLGDITDSLLAPRLYELHRTIGALHQDKSSVAAHY
ncbi:unnamed protein product [Linum trigynum]|uniref:Uncharacterized protein n=1 Tax=Linum trigynum TaxID=586398 RepID=A0AAV2D325_9ROSI